jgi:hypothetical protein
MAMSRPPWLYYLFGLLMLTVAAYCVVLLVSSVATKRRAGRDVEVSHLFMGVAMAGMFVGRWAFGPSAFWELIFGALSAWFLVESIQSIRRYGLHLSHALIHVVMNFTMVLVYLFPIGSSSISGSMSISMASTGARLDPGISFLLAIVVFASAIFTLASPYKGSSHFGSHAPAYALAGRVGSAPTSLRMEDSTPTVALEEIVAAPWLVDVSHVVMCIAMGFMLLLMI